MYSLLQKRQFISINGPTLKSLDDAVSEASYSGNIEALKKLINQDNLGKRLVQKSVSIQDSEGRNFLHLVANAGKTHLCKFFLEEVKVNANMEDVQGQNPLHHAILGENYDTAVYLLENGANPNAATNHGFTSLHYAAYKGIEELLCLLISKGAKVDAISNCGTPLHNAAAFGKKDSVRILLENGANPNETSHDHVSPLVVAIHARSYECTDLLIKVHHFFNLL